MKLNNNDNSSPLHSKASRLDTLQLSSKWVSKKQDIRALITFGVLGLYFLGMGIALANNMSNIKEYKTDYTSCSLAQSCTVKLIVSSDIPGPVYVYYVLNNYFQNHQYYYNSKNPIQLSGQTPSINNLDSCYPIITNNDNWKKKSLNNTHLDPNAPANPCGLIASTLFNDSYSIADSTNNPINISTSGIAWPQDVNSYRQPSNSDSIQWTNVSDEHFMVWMRPAGLSNFRKLWGVIPNGLKADTYQVTIQNNYNMTSTEGTKQILVSNISSLGGRNLILTIVHFIAAGICLFIILGVIYTSQRTKTLRMLKRMQQFH